MIRYHSTWVVICQFVMYISIILTSCAKKEEMPEDLSGYYLPIQSLGGSGVEYAYRSLADTTLPREVWKHVNTSTGLITSINYDERQHVVQKQFERVVENGVLIDSLHLYYYDSLQGSIILPVRILSPHR